MSLTELARALPDYAKDLRLNIGSLLTEPGLTDQQRHGLFVACAHATGNPQMVAAAEAEARPHLSDAAMTAAKAAASIMAMNNVYYRFVHLSANQDYATLPARLRMNVIGAPGIEKVDFELFSLAVSAINGCGMCIDAHEKVLRDHNVPVTNIQAAVRIGSVVNAVSKALQAMA